VVVLVLAVGHFLLEMVALAAAALLAKPVVLLFRDRDIMVVQDPDHCPIKQAVAALVVLAIHQVVLLVLEVLALFQTTQERVSLMLEVVAVVVAQMLVVTGPVVPVVPGVVVMVVKVVVALQAQQTLAVAAAGLVVQPTHFLMLVMVVPVSSLFAT
jgi:hypothetical protein